MNPLRTAIHFLMETTQLDRCVDANSINYRRELRRARRHATMSAESGNNWIGETIAAGRPAAIGRLGKHECGALAAHLGIRQFYKYTWAAPSYSEALLPEVGVFPASDEIYWRFSELLIERLRDFDACAMQLNPGETAILADHCPQIRRLERHALEPYYFRTPWSAQLAGKRVLVVHPFEPSIRAQFARRHEIWPNPPEVLPAFDLDVARSPVGFSRSGFNDWFAMLQWFEQRIGAIHRRTHFDVALIGCGMAGLPLAAFVKKLGAIAIHTGDLLPVLFGIRDGPIDQRADLQRFYNDAWVRPQENERPPTL